MKFCANCGSPLDENTRFCPNCGAVVANEEAAEEIQVTGSSEENVAESSEKGSKKLNRKVLLIAAGIIVVLLLAVIAVMLISSKNTIKLEEYITEPKYQGADGKGILDESDVIDAERLEADLQRKLQEIGTWDIEEDLDRMEEGFEVKVSPKENLSNGDKVKVTFSYLPGEYILGDKKIKFKDGKESFEVKDLGKTNKIDPFDYMKVSYRGASPVADIHVSCKKKAPVQISFTVVDEEVATGDKITVKAKCDKEELLEAGCELSRKEETYTCDPEYLYVTKGADMNEKTMSRIRSDAEDVLGAAMADFPEEFSCSSPAFAGTYILYSKTTKYGFDNKVYFVYKANVSAPGYSSPSTVYMPVLVENLIVNNKGDIDEGSYEPEMMHVADPPREKRFEYEGDVWNPSICAYKSMAGMYEELITYQKTDYNYEVSKELQGARDDSSSTTKKASKKNTEKKPAAKNNKSATKTNGSTDKAIKIVSVSASDYFDDDVVNGKHYDHSPECAVDGKLSTAWAVRDDKSGVGAYITLDLDGTKDISGVKINAGHQGSKDLYTKNTRPVDIQLEFDDGVVFACTLKDVSDVQTIRFDSPIKSSEVTLTVDKVVKGNKYPKDMCISEISLF